MTGLSHPPGTITSWPSGASGADNPPTEAR